MSLLVAVASADFYESGLAKWKDGDSVGALSAWEVSCNKESNEKACTNVAKMYTKGLGVNKDKAKAKEFKEKAQSIKK